MADTTPPRGADPTLGFLLRGLSALFWGLPLTLLVCIKTAANEWARTLDAIAPIFCTVLLLYGLLQVSHFHPEARLWHAALDRAKAMAIINVGLSPFLYFWNQMPSVIFFGHVVALMVLSSLVFLFNLNQVLHRLSSMLPDETVRADTHVFTVVNRCLLIGTVALLAVYYAMLQIDNPSQFMNQMRVNMQPWHQVLLLMLVLLPTAMTMTLLWKIKETVMHSIFDVSGEP